MRTAVASPMWPLPGSVPGRCGPRSFRHAEVVGVSTVPRRPVPGRVARVQVLAMGSRPSQTRAGGAQPRHTDSWGGRARRDRVTTPEVRRIPTAVLSAPVNTAGAGARRDTAATGRDASSSWFHRRGEREGRAQLVARRSIEVATPSESDAIGEVALDLIRVATHDPATLQHALNLCRSLSRDDPADERVKRAIQLLEQVTTFLGVPPRPYEVRTAHLPSDASRAGASDHLPPVDAA